MNRFAPTAAVAFLALLACGPRPTQAGSGAAPAAAPAPSAAAEAKAAVPAGGPTDPNAPVAKFQGGTITSADLEAFVKSDAQKLDKDYQQRSYELRQNALEELVTRKIIENKAKAEGLTPEALLKRDLQDKLPQPSDQEVKAIYDQAVAQGQKLPPLDQIRPQIVAYLQGQRSQEAVRAYSEKVRSDANVELLAYQPKRTEVAADGPSKGPKDAPITIVEFSDFECPFCGRAEENLQKVLAKYPGKIRLVYRDYPLPSHSHAEKAAEAAHCAGDQGKYWEMHGKLFANQRALGEDQLKQYAKALGLDGAKFEKCLASGEKAPEVDKHRRAGEEVGVSGTPAFFVNGVPLSGAQPVEKFTAIIDAELKKPIAKK
jgi:protein-disulfide isomerase